MLSSVTADFNKLQANSRVLFNYLNICKIKTRPEYGKVFVTPRGSSQAQYSLLALLAYFVLNGIQKNLFLFNIHF